MMKKEKQLIIPFVGLKEGIHQYEFEIDSTFFEQFEYSIIQDAKFKIKVEFEKKKTLFKLDFKLNGKFKLECDRCLDPLWINSEGHENLVVKFGDETYNETDEIKVISSAEYEMDLSDDVYQFIHTLIPTRVKHKKKKDCNPEFIKKLEELSIKQETEETDPRWAALSKFKDNSE